MVSIVIIGFTHLVIGRTPKKNYHTLPSRITSLCLSFDFKMSTCHENG